MVVKKRFKTHTHTQFLEREKKKRENEKAKHCTWDLLIQSHIRLIFAQKFKWICV